MDDVVKRLLDGIRKEHRRVVVVGDAMVDLWLSGRLEPSQDGCQKFVVVEDAATPGGAANAEQCLKHWGASTSMCSYHRACYPVKRRYVADGKIIFRADDERRLVLEAHDRARECALEMVECAGAVLLSDYDKGFLTPEFIARIAALCRARGVPCVADVKRAPEIYAGCVLKCNAAYAANYPVMAMCENGAVVTHGEHGPWYCKGGSTVVGTTLYPLGNVPVECINHIGAGDCFSAHLALALAYRFPLADAVALAHSAGRVYVQFPHNRAPYPDEVAADLTTRKASPSSDCAEEGESRPHG